MVDSEIAICGSAADRQDGAMTHDNPSPGGPEPAPVEVAASGTVDVTVARIRDAAQQHGMNVLAQVDHGGGARDAGLALRDEVLVLIGSARVGTAVMEAAPRAGLDLPLRLLVWDDAGTTRITWRDPRRLAATHGVTGLDEVLGRMAAALGQVVDAAA